MIYANKKHIVCQDSGLNYFFIGISSYNTLSRPVDKVEHSYKPIGPTILVEWEE